ncbi:FAD-binding domain-containing protein [Infundibulicybe gibba]|nr:FAD-binding domain-containing protein [Infundibulicybe gibba]
MTTIQGFTGSIITPQSPLYQQAIFRPSATSYHRYPLALKFALTRSPPLEVAVKGGGSHTSSASSTDGGLVIDLSKMNAVTVSKDKKTVSIQGGALWGDVYTEVAKSGLVVDGADVFSVGVGGYTTGGGYSNLSGHFGLAIDDLVEATVILADGSTVTCNAKERSDLFWAIRGGGNQFGIVANFVMKTHAAFGPALVGAIIYPGTELSEVLKATHHYLESQTATSKVIVTFARAPPTFSPSILLLPYVEGSAAQGNKTLLPFRSTNPAPFVDQVTSAPDFNAVSHAADSILAGVPPRAMIGGALFGDLWDDVVSKVYDEWASFTVGDSINSTIMWEFGFREKITEVKSDATAYPARKPHYYVTFTGRHTLPSTDAVSSAWINGLSQFVKQENTRRTGVKFPTPGNFAVGPESVSSAEVYGDALSRLRKIKAQYDPKKVWSRGWVIEPDFGHGHS